MKPTSYRRSGDAQGPKVDPMPIVAVGDGADLSRPEERPFELSRRNGTTALRRAVTIRVDRGRSPEAPDQGWSRAAPSALSMLSMPRRTLRQRLVLAALIVITPLNVLALSTLVYLLTRSVEVAP
jgi:hypothetical protein